MCWLTMKRLSSLCALVFAALVLVACGSDGSAPDPRDYQAHITGQIGGASVDLVIVLEPTGTLPQTPVSASPTPTLTPTPQPSSTPRPTPTHEITVIPTVAQTSIPKPTETPEPGRCVGVVTADPTLNVRATPGGTVIGTVSKGDTLTLEARQIVGTVTWYAIAETVSLRGWVSGAWLTLSGDCEFNATAFGVWLGPGASRDEAISFGDALLSHGRVPAATVYGERDTATILHDRGWLVAWRPALPDCPDTSQTAVLSARSWWSQWRAASTGVRYAYAVTANECFWKSAEYLRDWMSEIITLSSAAHIRVIPVVFNSGSPEFDWIPVLSPALAQLQAAHGCIGFNAYPVRVGVPLSRVDDWTRYTTFRWQMMGLPSGLDVCITEAARGDGAQPADFADLAQFVPLVDGRVRFVTFWYATAPGLLPAWRDANLYGKLAQLANAIN